MFQMMQSRHVDYIQGREEQKICLENAEGKTRVYTAVLTITAHSRRLRFKGNKSLLMSLGGWKSTLKWPRGKACLALLKTPTGIKWEGLNMER